MREGNFLDVAWACYFNTWFILIMYLDGSTQLVTMDEPR